MSLRSLAGCSLSQVAKLQDSLFQGCPPPPLCTPRYTAADALCQHQL